MSIFSFIVCLISQGSRNLFLLAGKQPPADKCQSHNCFLWNTLICIVPNFLWSASSPYHPQYSYHFIKWISAHFPHWTNQRSPWVYGLETNGTEWNSQWLKLWKKKKNLRSSQRPWFLPWGQNWLSAAFDTIDHFCIPRTCLVWLQDPKLACLPFFLWLPLPSLPHQFLLKSLTA